ncbi:MAG TPA: hypothetical protein VH916_02480 [Dehalococcoidia bacterium]
MNWELTAVIVLGTIGSLLPLAWAWYRDRKPRKRSYRPVPRVDDLAAEKDAAVMEAMALLSAKARRRA